MRRSIQTFRGQGVAKRSLRKCNFSIIFSTDVPAEPSRDELPALQERGMRPSIKVDVTSRRNHLDPMSRINLRAVHCVQQNWKIYPIGRIAEESWTTLCDEHFEASDDGFSLEYRQRQAPLPSSRDRMASYPPVLDMNYRPHQPLGHRGTYPPNFSQGY